MVANRIYTKNLPNDLQMLSILFASLAQVSGLSADIAVLYAESFILFRSPGTTVALETLAAFRDRSSSSVARPDGGQDRNYTMTDSNRTLVDMITYVNSRARTALFSTAVATINTGCIDVNEAMRFVEGSLQGFERYEQAAIYISILSSRAADCDYNLSAIRRHLETELIHLYDSCEAEANEMMNKDCCRERVNQAILLLVSDSNQLGQTLLTIDVCLSPTEGAIGELSSRITQTSTSLYLGANVTEIAYPSSDTYSTFGRNGLAQLSDTSIDVAYAQVWVNILEDPSDSKRRVDLFGVASAFTVSLEIEGDTFALSVAVGCDEVSRVMAPTFPSRKGWMHVSISLADGTARLCFDELSWVVTLPEPSWDDCFHAVTSGNRQGRLVPNRSVFIGPNALLNDWDEMQAENVKVRFYNLSVSGNKDASVAIYPARAHLIQLGDKKPVRCLTSNRFESRRGFCDCRPKDRKRVQQQSDAAPPLLKSKDDANANANAKATDIDNEYWFLMYTGAGAAVLLFAMFAASVITCFMWFHSTIKKDASVQASASEV